MILILLPFISSLKPVILLPPLYGTNLWISYNQTNKNWYCPETANDELLWVNPKWAVPPKFNCLFHFLQVFWNENNQSFVNRENVSIYYHNFGGEESVRYVVPDVMGYNFIRSFAALLDFLKLEGYEVGKNLFAAPYDWRIAPAGLDQFWPLVHDLVEKAYKENGNQRVTMFGYSCGGHSLQRFLAEYCKDQAWKDKYIDRAIFLAPSIGGVGQSLPALWEKIFPLIPFLKSKELASMIESLPVVLSHLPNTFVFGDKTIVRSKDDVDYTASQLRDLLVEHQKITGDNIKILDECTKKISNHPINPPGVPAYIIYNSGIDTDFFLHFKKGWNKPAKVYPIAGDGTVPSAGIEYACNNWPISKHTVQCLDMYRDYEEFKHTPLASNPYIHKIVLDLINGSWVNEKVRRIQRAPYVVVNNQTYVVREDIRKLKTLYEQSIDE